MKIVAKKRYGQHFLRDTGILNRIVGLIRPAGNDLMIEIGGGEGALSIRLAPEVGKLLVIEVDQDLIPVLVERLAPFPNAEILGSDVLRVDFAGVASSFPANGMRLRIVGNLPYNIGTAIIEKLLLSGLCVEDMIFMLQLETAERINAAPGSKEYGFFSVFCQHFCETNLAFKVAPACFVPKPKVYSAIVILRPRNLTRTPESEQFFLKLVRAAFAYRRKKLANSLARNPEFGQTTAAILKLAGIDGARRAEDLSVTEYERLAETLREIGVRS